MTWDAIVATVVTVTGALVSGAFFIMYFALRQLLRAELAEFHLKVLAEADRRYMRKDTYYQAQFESD